MKFLIVDDEKDICEIVKFLIHNKFPGGCETIIASSGNEAIAILKEDVSIDYCICDHNMPDGKGSDVIKFLLSTQSKTKFVLCSTVNPSEQPHDYPLGSVFASIQKPMIRKGIENLIQLINQVQSGTGEEHEEHEETYVPIGIHTLVLFGKLPADIYIKMSENKFIKCINKSEEFGIADEIKYKEKTLETLYVKKGEETATINEIVIDAVSKIMARKNLPLSDKMSFAYAQLVGLIKFSGITPQLAEEIKQNLNQTVTTLMKSPLVCDFWKKMNLLGDYPSRLYTLHSMLAYLIVNKLPWYSESTIFKLTLSSFLQDISLDSIAMMEICDYQEFMEKSSNFSSAEIKRYNEHPYKATEMLATFQEIPPDVDRILIEQHEMPDGKGIPRKLNAGQISPLSCLFILSGILARHILKNKEAFDIDLFIKNLETQGYNQGNFKESFAVIKNMGKIVGNSEVI